MPENEDLTMRLASETGLEIPLHGLIWSKDNSLTLKGKKKKLTRNQLINYFGKEQCELTDKSVDRVLESISLSVPKWKELIKGSFLSLEMQEKYLTLLERRLNILRIQ